MNRVKSPKLIERKRRERRSAMLAFTGIRKDAPETLPTDAYTRELRRDDRRLKEFSKA